MGSECEPESPNDKGKKAHYWVIDETNFGICKRCGAGKQFLSQIDGWQMSRGAKTQVEPE